MTKFVPTVIALDFETALTDGTPSVEYYRDDFRVVSAAFAYRKADGTVGKMFHVEHSAVFSQLCAIPAECVVIVHNYQFEYGVLKHCFPGLERLITHDTMRLVQVGDNGGKQMAYQPKVETFDDLLDSVDGDNPGVSVSGPRVGLGLVASAARWLPPEWQDHKAPYHAWLREHKGIKKGQEGAHLTSLPPDLLEAYNVADAEVTLRLYETLTAEFARIGYDYRMDHELYKSTARMVAEAKGMGVRVQTQDLQAYVKQIKGEVAEIEASFRQHFSRELAQIEATMHDSYVMKVKTAKCQEKRRLETAESFNPSSGKQLTSLFVSIVGITPKFWTKESKNKTGKPRKKEFVPQPSFKSAHLSTYGKGGELLRTRRKRLLVLQQAQALLKLAEHDGRWHADIRAAGTATGRLAGGRV